MLPKKVKKRASLLSIFLLLSVIGVFLILNALNKNILYFNSPTDIKISQDINYNKKMRVGGMVKKNTLNIKDQEIRFIITDFKNEVEVSFKGTIPNLFAEGKGVVAEGKLQDKKFKVIGIVKSLPDIGGAFVFGDFALTIFSRIYVISIIGLKLTSGFEGANTIKSAFFILLL